MRLTDKELWKMGKNVGRMCCLCGRTVDRVEVFQNRMAGQQELRFFCHGKVDIMILSDTMGRYPRLLRNYLPFAPKRDMPGIPDKQIAEVLELPDPMTITTITQGSQSVVNEIGVVTGIVYSYEDAPVETKGTITASGELFTLGPTQVNKEAPSPTEKPKAFDYLLPPPGPRHIELED